MRTAKKKWYWILTWPFAHNNYTTIGETIYYKKGNYPSFRTISHEIVHIEQQKRCGVVKFIFLYLFAFPFFYNKYRFKWELEAYSIGTKLPKGDILKILRSYKYGWLMNKDPS